MRQMYIWCLLLVSVQMWGYIVQFVNETDKEWTFRVKLSGVVVCKDDNVTVGPQETKEYNTKKIATNCCVNSITNITAQNEHPELAHTFVFNPSAGFDNCQSFSVHIIDDYGGMAITGYGTPLKDALGEAVNFVGAMFEQQVTGDIDVSITKRSKNAFKEPADSIPLHEAMFLGSHNAFAYPPVFSGYYQHNINIAQQLELGVRGFMLDLYDHKDSIKLCHAQCTGPKAFALTGSKDPNYQDFTDVLQQFGAFLENHPKAILFLYCEDHASESRFKKAFDNAPRVKKRLLTPQDWSLSKHDGGWPTLGWMRNNDKRVVVFTDADKDVDAYAWRAWEHLVENAFGVTGLPQLCEFRNEQTRQTPSKLYFMNYFGKITAGFKQSRQLLRRDNIRKIVEYCHTSGSGVTMKPNVIFVDRLEALVDLENRRAKTIIDYINEHNKSKAKQFGS